MVFVATYAEMLLQSDHFFESFVDCIPQIVHSITRMSIRPSLMRSQALSQPHRARRSLLDQFKHLTNKFSQTSSFSVFIFLISVTFQNSWAGLSCLLKRWVSHVYTVLMLFRSILGSGAKYLRPWFLHTVAAMAGVAIKFSLAFLDLIKLRTLYVKCYIFLSAGMLCRLRGTARRRWGPSPSKWSSCYSIHMSLRINYSPH